MPSIRTRADTGETHPSGTPVRLFVSWQDPESRWIRPVGVLTATSSRGERSYEFRYVRGARELPRFRPFVEFPELGEVYRSSELFPMFQNRLMARERADYGDYLASLDLELDAEPFEVLAASFGRRTTDTVEVFAEPRVDPASGVAECRFLARGIRHITGAPEAVSRLRPGEHLRLHHEIDNEFDHQALVLLTKDGDRVGYVPVYLADYLHRAASIAGGSLEAIDVRVEHANADGPTHLRLLCHVRSPAPPGGLTAPDLEPIVPD